MNSRAIGVLVLALALSAFPLVFLFLIFGTGSFPFLRAVGVACLVLGVAMWLLPHRPSPRWGTPVQSIGEIAFGLVLLGVFPISVPVALVCLSAVSVLVMFLAHRSRAVRQ